MATKKTALITGASTGLGEAFSRQAAISHDTILVARNEKKLKELAVQLKHQFGGKHEIIKADLTEKKDLEKVAKVLENEPELELLVNNAGFGTIGEFSNLEVETEISEIDLNISAVVRLSHAALQSMKKRNDGRIINISSMAGFLSAPYSATYAASKAFVKSFSEALYEENRTYGIYVQALCPGFTRTEFQQRANIDVSKIPDFLWMNADEVAQISLEEKQKPVLIPGVINQSGILMGSLMPEELRRNLTAKLMQSV
ncbi:MAG: SDR family oxidoreductase [Leptospiraceae bacterium]|nr:SDR family oxidoreductase [Leptospiraceae bacterium]